MLYYTKAVQNNRSARQRAYLAAHPEALQRQIAALKAYRQKHLRSIEERFWEKVDVKNENECWNWHKPFKSPYPQISWRDKYTMPVYSHWVAFELTYGPRPKGAHICHHCDNKACCNPKHLYAGSQQTNTRDAITRNRLKLPPVCCGEVNATSKLTALQVSEIRNRLRLGETRSQLCKAFGVSRSCIESIATGKTWKHINL